MRFSVSFKDPDTLYEAIMDAVCKDVAQLGLEGEERDAVVELRADKVRERVAKWFEYGEHVLIDIDTDADTATVRRVS